MKILLLDNYDSFTFNLVHRFRELGVAEVFVIRNDRVSLEELDTFTHLVLSPGPGIPSEAGSMLSVIEELKESVPILGVCLGHQALAESYGAKLSNLEQVVHGKEQEIDLDADCSIFKGLPSKVRVGRYHSWVVDRETLPEELEVTATGPRGEVMAIAHKRLPLFGVQFHPESIMTDSGLSILQNWLSL